MNEEITNPPQDESEPSTVDGPSRTIFIVDNGPPEAPEEPPPVFDAGISASNIAPRPTQPAEVVTEIAVPEEND